LFNLHEQQTVIFSQTGHFVVNLPQELRQQIERLAYLEHRTERDWMVERLTECVQDERSTATLAKDQERQRRDAEILKQVRSHPSDQETAKDIIASDQETAKWWKDRGGVATAKDIIEWLKDRQAAAQKAGRKSDNEVAPEVGQVE
jgi:hypothetical protein